MESRQYTVMAEGCEIRFSLTRGILRAQVEGANDSYAISLAYWNRISEERRRCGACSLLVIENLEQNAAPDDALALVEDLTQMGLENCKIAYVDRSSELRSVQEHIAILVREHGILAAVFGEESEAMIWLRHGEE